MEHPRRLCPMGLPIPTICGLRWNCQVGICSSWKVGRVCSLKVRICASVGMFWICKSSHAQGCALTTEYTMKPFISVTQGLSGWFAVLYLADAEGEYAP